MSVKITFTVTSTNPNSIWNQLALRLGREPSIQEAKDEVRRILSEAKHDRLSEVAR